MTQKLTVSALVRNRSGVLLRVAGLFARRGYNIRSLTVSETEHPEFSRMTVVSEVEPEQVKQVEAQLLKLEDVIKVAHLVEGKLGSSELLLRKVDCLNKVRPQVLKTVIAYGARVKDIGHTMLTAELTGEPERIDAFIADMSVHGIAELSRSGITALESGDTVIND
mgnify:FL=1